MTHNPLRELDHDDFIEHLRSLNGDASSDLKLIGDFFHDVYMKSLESDDNMLRNMAFTGMWLVNFDIAFLQLEKDAHVC